MAERPYTYGGQAVLEGVMIRGRDHVSVAVRRPDGTIATKCEAISHVVVGRLRRIPLIRGIIVLIETLILGMWALNYSANVGMGSEGKELTRGSLVRNISFSLLFAIGLFFIVPVFASRPLDEMFRSDIASNIAEGLLRLALFVAYIFLISRMRDIRHVFMYHGAEHMVVHAREHNLPLATGYIRRFPTAHPRCGTAFLLTVVLVSIVAFVFVGRNPFWWLIVSRIALIPVIAAISYEIIRLSGRYSANPLVNLIAWPNLALQKLTTRVPDDDQIEIAIVAMENAIAADEGRTLGHPVRP